MNQTLQCINQIHYISDRITTSILKHHPNIEINAGQMRIVSSLWDGEGISLVELASRNHLKKSTLSTMLPKLIEAGYITQNPDEKDLRAMKIYLTEKGKDLKAVHQNTSNEMEERLFANIDLKDREVFLNILEMLKYNLNSLEKEMQK